LKNYINYLLILFSVAYIFFLIQKKKTYWDAVPYLGAVLAIDEKDNAKIHESTYQLLKENTSIQEQQKLIEGHPFCKSIYDSQYYFAQQLPFFQVKFLYLYTSYIFYKIGVPLYDTLFLVVLIASILIFIIIYNWLKKYHGNGLSLLFSVFLFLCWFNIRSFIISSPDALAGLFFITAIYFYLEKENQNIAYLFLFLAALTRPDYLFFVVCFYSIAILLLKVKPSLFATATTLVCVTCVLLISYNYQYDGWQMFYRSFIDLTVSPQTEAGKFSIDVYLTGLLNGVKVSLNHWSTFLFFLMLMLPFIFLKKLSVAEKIIFYSILSSVVIRFLIHPWLEERFVFIYIDIFIIVFLKHIDLSRFKHKNIVEALKAEK
jgi:hypothetical protein